MTVTEELKKLRTEARVLRKRAADLHRAREAHAVKNEKLEERASSQRKKIQELTTENSELKQEIASLKSRLGLEIEKAKKYAGMLFKSRTKKPPQKVGVTRGGVTGHTGKSREKPTHIDREIDVSLSHCYDCHTPLQPTASVDERIVEDIPQPATIVTTYRIQRQWCPHCHKEVRGTPRGTLPGMRFGIGVLSLILILKYRSRAPLERITEILQSQYHLSITSQGVQRLLNTTRTHFTKQYNSILKEIQNAPVRHADETSWRINGVNSWCWLFATPTAALYTIEATRGKGVPERFLGTVTDGVLVRDDYAGYAALPSAQQSCWAHLLRVSHEAVEKEGASETLRALHTELKTLFDALSTHIAVPFLLTQRKEVYAHFLTQIDTIIGRAYIDDDTKAIQTRITNQRGNLITALLHESAPLTNNFAERMIRPMVITRKISGGSQSDSGAATHAVNMSIMQTLSLRGQDFLEGISEILHRNSPRYGLGEG